LYSQALELEKTSSMKTLFTNEKAVAIFSCSGSASTKAIRLHVYDYNKVNWDYEYSFIIENKEISPESVNHIIYTKELLIVSCIVNSNKVEYHYNPLTKAYQRLDNFKNSFSVKETTYSLTQRLSNIGSKLSLMVKMPQLTNFF
jgi:hypothetical protein